MGWEGQPPAAPMGAVTATRHLSCACTCRVRQRGKGREGVSVSIRCVQITHCAWCAAIIPNHTLSLSQLHADGMWIGREGEEGGRREGGGAAHSFPPSHIQLAHTTPHLLLTLFLSSHLSPSHPPSMLTSSPPPIWLPTHSTPLLLPLNLPLLTHTHARP